MAGGVVALIYHDVVASEERDAVGFPGPVAGVYKLDPGSFSAHLDAIAASGLRSALSTERSGVILTFDDGGASALAISAELHRRSWRGAFFVVTSRIGKPGFIDAAGIRELAARGHEVGSHSHTHPRRMAALTGIELAEEWNVSRERLTELLGVPPLSAAVPGGSVSREVIRQASRAGYRRLFTSNPRVRTARRYGIDVIGRYTIWANDPPQLAAALARGAPAPRAQRWLSWQAKIAAKRIAPGAYETLRAVRAERTMEPSRKAARRSV